MYTVSSVSEWNTLAITSTSFNSRDMVVLIANLTFTSQPTPITLGNKVSFVGGNFKITLNYVGINGLFVMNGGIVESLEIDGGNNTLNIKEGTLVNYAIGGDNQYGTITSCKLTNCNVGADGGGFCGYNFGDVNNSSVIEICVSTATVTGERGGGYVGSRCKNVSFSNSCYEGSLDNINTGGFTGSEAGYNSTLVNFDTCFSNNVLDQDYCSGFVCNISIGGTINIKECIFRQYITSGYCGGFVGDCGVNCVLNITDSYTIDYINNATSGCFIGIIPDGSLNTSSVTLTNCYQSGNMMNGGGLVGYCGGLCVVNARDCSLNTATVKSQGSNVVNQLGSYFYTDLTHINNNNLPITWKNAVWLGVAGVNEYPLLKSFKRRAVWSLVYTSYATTPSFKTKIPINVDTIRKKAKIRLGVDPAQLGELHKVRILNCDSLVVRWMDGNEFSDGTYRAYFGPEIQTLEEL